ISITPSSVWLQALAARNRKLARVLLPQRIDKERASRRDSDVLAIVHHVAHRAAIYLTTEVLLPQQIAVLAVERIEVAFTPAAENQIRRRGQHTRPRNIAHLEFPFLIAGLRIEGANHSEALLLGLTIWNQIRLCHRSVACGSAESGAFREYRAAVLPPRNVEQAGVRAVGWRIPVGAAQAVRLDQHRRRAVLLPGNAHRPALLVKAGEPVRLDERLAHEELTAGPIQNVEQAIAIGPHHHLARLALILDISQNRNLRRVIIHGVVRRELVIPLQLPRIRIESHHRIAIQVVAQPNFAIGVRRGISRAPEGQVGIWIISARVPDRRAASLPGIARPSLMPRLALPRDGVETPNLLSGLRVEGRNISADRAVATRCAHDYFIFDDQWSVRDCIAVGSRPDGRVPKNLAILGVDRQEMRVQRSHVERVAQSP